MPSVVVTGAAGLLGRVVSATFTRGGWSVTRLVRQSDDSCPEEQIDVDLTDREALRSKLTGRQFDACVHCAALTSLRTCEANPDYARAVHVTATADLVSILDTPTFVYISTDSVFDGRKGMYREEDECRPLNHYARTKQAGEQEVQRHPGGVVLRTNLYDIRMPIGNSLAEWAFQSLSRQDRFHGYGDVVFSPLHTSQLADAVVRIAAAGLGPRILHVGADSALSKYEFIVRLGRVFQQSTACVEEVSGRVSAAEIQRPLNTSLDSSVCRALFPDLSYSIDAGLQALRDKVAGYGVSS